MVGLTLSLVLGAVAPSYLTLEPGVIGLPAGKTRVLEARWRSAFDEAAACRPMQHVPLAAADGKSATACRGEATCLSALGGRVGAGFIAAVDVSSIGLGDEGPYSVSATVLATESGEVVADLTQVAPDADKLFGIFRFFAARSCKVMGETLKSSGVAAAPATPVAAGPLLLPPTPATPIAPVAAAPAANGADLDLDLLPDLDALPLDALALDLPEPAAPVAAPPAPLVRPTPAAPPPTTVVAIATPAPTPKPVAAPVVVPPVAPAVQASVARPGTSPSTLPPAAIGRPVEPAPRIAVPGWARWAASGVAVASGVTGAGFGVAVLGTASARDAATQRAEWTGLQADATRLSMITNVAWTVAALGAASAAGLWLFTDETGAGGDVPQGTSDVDAY